MNNNTKNYALLAKQIGAVMANPDCPVKLYEAIGEVVCDMSNFIDYDSPEIIEQALAAYDKSDKKRRSAK